MPRSLQRKSFLSIAPADGIPSERGQSGSALSRLKSGRPLPPGRLETRPRATGIYRLFMSWTINKSVHASNLTLRRVSHEEALLGPAAGDQLFCPRVGRERSWRRRG